MLRLKLRNLVLHLLDEICLFFKYAKAIINYDCKLCEITIALLPIKTLKQDGLHFGLCPKQGREIIILVLS